MANGHGGARPGAGRKPLSPAERQLREERRRTRANVKRAQGSVAASRALVAAGAPGDGTDAARQAARRKEAWERLAAALGRGSGRRGGGKPLPVTNALLPQFPPMAVPKDKKLRMAMDQNLSWSAAQWGAIGNVYGLAGAEGLVFLGYPYLSQLAQRTEYRIISETIADDATRRWIDFEIVGSKKEIEERAEEDREDPEGARVRRKERVASAGKTEKVKAIKDKLEELELRDAIYCVCRDDGFFGRGHLFLDFGDDLDDDGITELTTNIGDGRDEISKSKVNPEKPLRRIKKVEPLWTYPTTYNAVNPLLDDWYDPQVWFVMGKQIHRSRLLTFIAHPVPDILKPVYAFGGISLSQLAKPYIDIWLQTRESVAQLVHSFSVMVLKTDLQVSLQGGGDDLIARAMAFNAGRDNQGIFLLNKNTEDFTNVSASLAGLHELQAQSQEHICSAVRVPTVKYTGISPTGLNASSEGELRAYDSSISAYQNRFIRPHLTRIINFVQLSLFGEIDHEITPVFESLWDMNEKERAEIQKLEAERDQILVDIGSIAPREKREQVINDPHMPYGDLDPDDEPDLREEEEAGLVPEGGARAVEGLVEGGPETGEKAAPLETETKEGKEVPGGEPVEDEEAGPRLPWGDQYEWMRGYDLPPMRGDTALSKEPLPGSVAAKKRLRVGSRVRFGENGDGGAGRVFGFVRVDDYVAIFDAETDRVSFVSAEQVSTRPVAAQDAIGGVGPELSGLGGTNRYEEERGVEPGRSPRPEKRRYRPERALEGLRSGATVEGPPDQRAHHGGVAQEPWHLEHSGLTERDRRHPDMGWPFPRHDQTAPQPPLRPGENAEDEFVESEHPRGQPENAGQFASGSSAANKPGKTSPKGFSKPMNHEEAVKIYDMIGTVMRVNLSDSERTALKAYAGNDYKTINDGLTRLETLPPQTQAEVRYVQSVINAAIQKSPLPAKATVYRSMVLRNVKNLDGLIGKIISNKGFTSTSLSAKIAESFTEYQAQTGKTGAVIAEIRLPKGMPALHMSGNGGIFAEQEFLLQSNAKWRVVAVRKGKPNRILLEPVRRKGSKK